mgnify:CR=1 FL=1
MFHSTPHVLAINPLLLIFSLSKISGVAVDANGNILFTDTDKYCVRRYNLSSDSHDVYAGECGTYADVDGNQNKYIICNFKCSTIYCQGFFPTLSHSPNTGQRTS